MLDYRGYRIAIEYDYDKSSLVSDVSVQFTVQGASGEQLEASVRGIIDDLYELYSGDSLVTLKPSKSSEAPLLEVNQLISQARARAAEFSEQKWKAEGGSKRSPRVFMCEYYCAEYLKAQADLGVELSDRHQKLLNDCTPGYWMGQAYLEATRVREAERALPAPQPAEEVEDLREPALLDYDHWCAQYLPVDSSGSSVVMPKEVLPEDRLQLWSHCDISKGMSSRALEDRVVEFLADCKKHRWTAHYNELDQINREWGVRLMQLPQFGNHSVESALDLIAEQSKH